MNLKTVSLPTVENAGVIAIEISENVKPELNAQEQSFFVAGFQECIKYLKKSKELMNVITDFEELPYPIELVKEVAKIRFQNITNTLNETIIICNLIRGLIELNDSYVLSNDSIEIYEKIIDYNIETKLNLIDFKKYKDNIKNTPELNLIDMKSWYCSRDVYNIMNHA